MKMPISQTAAPRSNAQHAANAEHGPCAAGSAANPPCTGAPHSGGVVEPASAENGSIAARGLGVPHRAGAWRGWASAWARESAHAGYALRGFLLALLVAAVARPQVAVEANKGYQTPEARAKVAKTLADPHRAQRLKPHELVAQLHIPPGGTVIDVGTGIGVMLPYLSEAVGPSGHVIAEDIAPDFLDKAKARIHHDHLANVRTILGTEHDPKLPQGQADLVFILDVYHHFNYPGEMLSHIGQALKPGGRLVIVDFYKKKRGPEDKDMSDHIRIDRDAVIKEVESNGYKLISHRDHTTNTYVLIFHKA